MIKLNYGTSFFYPIKNKKLKNLKSNDYFMICYLFCKKTVPYLTFVQMIWQICRNSIEPIIEYIILFYASFFLSKSTYDFAKRRIFSNYILLKIQNFIRRFDND